MRTLNIILFCIIVQISLGQQRTFIGDTAFWYNLKMEEYKNIGVDQIIDSKKLLTIRFSIGNEIIDIWTNDKKDFWGKQFIFTSSYDPKGKKKKKYYTKVEIIGQDTAKIIFQLLGNYKILEMPVQDSIKGWNNGLDGTMYFFEYSDDHVYSFKNYWTPTLFKTVPEAVSLTNFITDLQVLLNVQQKLAMFFSSLPGNTSYKYGDNDAIYIKKRKEKKEKNAP